MLKGENVLHSIDCDTWLEVSNLCSSYGIGYTTVVTGGWYDIASDTYGVSYYPPKAV